MTPQELRRLSAAGEFHKPTAGYCDGYVQANLLAVPNDYADAFEQFCRNNPKPCPLLEKIGPGSHVTGYLSDGADLLNTIPRYLVWENGQITKEVEDISEHYRNDLVFFLLGCSFSFEEALITSGIALRHLAQKKNVAMFNTTLALQSSGPFSGNMVVSMRPIHRSLVAQACAITAHYPKVHGEPVHVGYPEFIGIDDLATPDYGEPVEIKNEEIPVFWACGVTPQNVLIQSKVPFAITHAPGYMFVSDRKNTEYFQCVYQ
ncbi:MAG: putative hydro-lyase [Desulfopila sp.]